MKPVTSSNGERVKVLQENSLLSFQAEPRNSLKRNHPQPLFLKRGEKRFKKSPLIKGDLEGFSGPPPLGIRGGQKPDQKTRGCYKKKNSKNPLL